MKKLLTLCLAFAMIIATCAFVTSASAGTAANAEETGSQTKSELTVKAKEVYTFVDGSAEHTADKAPANAGWQDVLGMTRFVDSMTGDAKTYIGFDEVDVSNYAYVNFKAMFWAEGGVGSYADTDIYTAENEDSGYNAKIFYAWAGNLQAYTESSLYVSIPTAAIKNKEGKVSGIIIKNSVTKDTSGWFMIGDLTFSNYIYTRVDTANSNSVSGDATYGVALQSGGDSSYAKLWKAEELVYRSAIAARAAFVTTVKFIAPIPATDVDYFCMKIIGWDDEKYAAVTLKNLDGTTVKTLDVYYAWNLNGELTCYLPADGLKNESGMIEGFILDCPKATNLLFTDAIGYKGYAELEPVIDILQSRSGEGALVRQNEWPAIPPVKAENLCYNGNNIQNGTISVKFKMPIDSSVFKTIDFKAFIWNTAALKDVEIRKLDGTLVETIKVKSSYAAENNGDLSVKINAELLADENGMVGGFKMNVLNNEHGHLLFSSFSGNTEAKTYTVTYKAEGSEDITKTFTAATKASYEAPAVPEKAHYTGAWATDEISFTEGQVINAVYTAIEYTATFKADGKTVGTVKYTVESKDEVTAPAVPEKEHYTGAWESYTLNYDNEQVINAVYTAKQYSVTFKADGETVSTVNYTIDNKDEFAAPAVPEKAHYTGEWNEYELAYSANQEVTAKYTAIEYTATFKADGETVGTVKYTVENKDEVTAPAVPEKAHYNGAWENYTLNYDNEQVINAVYAAKQYSVTFKADGETVSTVNYTIENKDEVTAPAVPEKAHYTGEWNEYELAYSANQEVTAKYTAITYTITFKADGETVGTVSYTEETKGSITAPAVPEKSGYTGVWAEFVPEFDNAQVVEAQYTEITASDGGCVASMSGCGIAIAAIGMAVAVLKKKRV